jgi:hypothetical protein
MANISPRALLAIAALTALVTLSACGGGGGGGGGGGSSTTPPAPPPVQAEPVLAANHTALSSAGGLSKPYWPEWNHPGTDAVDGVGCYKVGTYHTHALLSIYKDGQRLASPGSIGRNASCEFELHTHEGTGTIHIESDTQKTFTLGQYFALWGQNLSAASVAGLPGAPTFYIIENETLTKLTTNPAEIALTPHKEILIITGTPPKEVPRFDWGSSNL